VGGVPRGEAPADAGPWGAPRRHPCMSLLVSGVPTSAPESSGRAEKIAIFSQRLFESNQNFF